MPVGIASSVMAPHFGLLETVRLAAENNIPVVQLFVNVSLDNPGYFDELVNLLKETGVKVVVHLPNLGRIRDEDLYNVIDLYEAVPDLMVGTLVHHQPSTDKVPVPEGAYKLFRDIPVAIENSVTGNFNEQSVYQAIQVARDLSVPFVFDPLRVMYLPEGQESRQLAVVRFIENIINQLDPEKDIIHLADKTSWTQPMRECVSALGGYEGVMFPVIPTIKEFIAKGGTVIMEHENVEMALASVEFLGRNPLAGDRENTLR